MPSILILHAILLHVANSRLSATVAAASTNGPSTHVSLGSVFFRLLVSLVVVLGVIWILAQYVKRRGMPGARRTPGARVRGSGPSIEVLTRQPLGKGIALVMVRVGTTLLLLGVTAQQVTTLGELDPDTLELGEEAVGTPTGSATILDWVGRSEGIFSNGMRRPSATASDTVTGTVRVSSKLEQLREITTRRS